MKHHPDMAQSDSSSSEEFARICEAYDVLSNGKELFWVKHGGSEPPCSPGADQHQQVVLCPAAHARALVQQPAEPVSCRAWNCLSTTTAVHHLICFGNSCCSYAAKLKGTYDLYGEDVLKSTTEGA
jgi:hypothetical protein